MRGVLNPIESTSVNSDRCRTNLLFEEPDWLLQHAQLPVTWRTTSNN